MRSGGSAGGVRRTACRAAGRTGGPGPAGPGPPGEVLRSAQYQPVDFECDHAPHGEPYRESM
jgi:hypothetical protein